MGVMNHNAVLASTWSDEHANGVKEWIAGRSEVERDLFLFGGKKVNNEQTIVLVPDGSKEGWQESENGDALRQAFIERLEQDDYEDGSSPWSWVEVGYGEFGQKVLRGNNRNCYTDEDYSIGA